MRDDEELISSDIKHQIGKKLLGSQSIGREGWYYQQLLKIAACLKEDGNKILIWDADTVPLRSLNFFTDDNCPVYYTGSEANQPYFCLIKKFIGVDRQVNFSFISQCFPLRREWLLDLINCIEKNSNMSWVDAIIAHIDPAQPSSFSEYETMGSFFVMRYGKSLHFTDARWMRFGKSWLGDVGSLNKWQLECASLA